MKAQSTLITQNVVDERVDISHVDLAIPVDVVISRGMERLNISGDQFNLTPIDFQDAFHTVGFGVINNGLTRQDSVNQIIDIRNVRQNHWHQWWFNFDPEPVV